MRKCPYCAEEIQDEAIICRFCKSDLKITEMPIGINERSTNELVPKRINVSTWGMFFFLPVFIIGVLLYMGVTSSGSPAWFVITILIIGVVLLKKALNQFKTENKKIPHSLGFWLLVFTGIPLSVSLGLTSKYSANTVSDHSIKTVNVETLLGCSDKDYLEKIISYGTQKDNDAQGKAVFAGISSGLCVNFKGGEKVFVADWKFGFNKIRHQGQTEEYWVQSEGLY